LPEPRRVARRAHLSLSVNLHWAERKRSFDHEYLYSDSSCRRRRR
jgi:hypothetical protein